MHTSMMMAVNSPPVPHRDVSNATTSAYRPYNEEFIPVPRRVDDLERTKKDKKWSLGKLFRRKKKEDDSSSSESDEGVNTRSPSKKKCKKKKKTPAVNNFDHIVIRDTRRAQSLAKPNIRDPNDDGVLSDPSAGFLNYRKKNKDVHGASKESLSLREDSSHSKTNKTALDTPSRKTRKGRLKARVEALRNSMRGDSSSDEESLQSSNSSSMLRFRSDDSLMRSRDSSLNKRSRSARNERYIKRLSRDEENQLNKEAELLQQGYTKAEVEMFTRTPTSQSSGYGTCKREQNQIKQDSIHISDVNRRPLKSESVSSFPSTQSYPSSINFNAKVNNEHINYSIQCPANNFNRESLYANNNREKSVSNQYENPESVLCVKFPLGNVTNIRREEKAPPVPPPRDMHRKVVTPLSMYYENNPIIADRLSNNQKVLHGVPNNDFERIMRRSQERSLGPSFNGLRRPISNSEDHIAMQNFDNMKGHYQRNDQPRRPASVSAEPHNYGLYMNSAWRKPLGQNSVIKPEPIQPRNDILYLADQSPRSRRPISIKNGQNGHENTYLSDSQTTQNLTESVTRRPRNASAEFWKKIDDTERQRRQQNIYANTRSSSDFTSNAIQQRVNSLSVQNKFGSCNNDVQNKNRLNYRASSVDTTDSPKIWKATTEYKRSVTIEPQKVIDSPIAKTHMRHKSDTYVSSINQPSDDERSSERRKSTNLDDALNELEAIYNSLGLGDEDLLDRAERRELMTPKINDHFNDWNGNDDEVQLRSQPTTPLRRVSRRSTLPDKLQDDMAFRRMNSLTKDKQNYKDAQAQISYMLASPVYVPYASDDDRRSERNEPDIVHDDVMYRNITQTNNRLKTIDPQPPFGIPIGPVSPAPQSDYLHATPENKGRPRFIPRKSPDLVSDDLAYRSLRKDNRHSIFNGDDYSGYVNNNQGLSEFPLTKESAANLKKKRAVRSLSANIFTMIQKEIDDALNMSKMTSLQKTNSNSDVMKRLRESLDKNDNEQDHPYPRNKVKHRHNTVSLFVNNTHAPSHNFTKDDSFIPCDDKHLVKPPSCDKSKSSSPSNRSPQASKRSSKDEFQQVLSMLAQEAMDTSNKLGVALAELDKNRNSNEKKSDIQSRLSDRRLSFLNGLTNKYDEVLPETKYAKATSPESCKQPSEKVRNEEYSKAKRTEDSLLVISDQLHRVEDKLKHSFEKELNVEEQDLTKSNYVPISEELSKAQETAVALESKLRPDFSLLSENRDVNKTDRDTEKSDKPASSPKLPITTNPLNPFLNADEKLGEINAFKELKDGISDLIAGITQVNEKLFAPKPTKSEKESVQVTKVSGISEASEKLTQVSQNEKQPDIPTRASINLSLYEDDLDIRKDPDSTEYNSSEELASIFKLDSNTKSVNNESRIHDNSEKAEEKIREELSSPKLVQTMSQQLRRYSVDNTEDTPSQSNSLPNNVVPWRTKRQNSSHNETRGEN